MKNETNICNLVNELDCMGGEILVEERIDKIYVLMHELHPYGLTITCDSTLKL